MEDDNVLPRPHVAGEEDLTVEQSILPNAMLNHSHILDIVVKIRNVSLRKEVLFKEDINFILVDNIIFTIEKLLGTTFKVGDLVVFKLDLVTRTERVFEIAQVIKTSKIEHYFPLRSRMIHRTPG